MVYFYEAELTLAADPDSGKGRCHALGRTNEKVQLLAFDNYVALLTLLPTSIPYVSKLIQQQLNSYQTIVLEIAFKVPVLGRVL